jgi:hypothetical protein
MQEIRPEAIDARRNAVLTLAIRAAKYSVLALLNNNILRQRVFASDD